MTNTIKETNFNMLSEFSLTNFFSIKNPSRSITLYKILSNKKTKSIPTQSLMKYLISS